MASNHPFLPQHFNMLGNPPNLLPNSWQQAPIPMGSLPQNQLQDNIFFFEIPNYIAPVQQAPPPLTYQQYHPAPVQQGLSTTSMQQQQQQQQQHRSAPQQTSMSQYLNALGTAVPPQRMMVQAQPQIQVTPPYQTGMPDQNFLNYLLQQGFTIVPQQLQHNQPILTQSQLPTSSFVQQPQLQAIPRPPQITAQERAQPTIAQQPQSLVAQAQLPSLAFAQQPQLQVVPRQLQQASQPRPQQTNHQPQVPSWSVVQQQQSAVPRQPQPTLQPQLLPSSTLYEQLQQYRIFPQKTPLTLDDIKKQQLLLEDLIRRSTAIQKTALPKPVQPPLSQQLVARPIQQKPNHPPSILPMHARLTPPHQRVIPSDVQPPRHQSVIRPITSDAPSQPRPVSADTHQQAVIAQIQKDSQQALLTQVDVPINTQSTSLPIPSQPQQVPLPPPMSLPPWHSQSLEQQKLARMAIEEARQKEVRNAAQRDYYHRKKAEMGVESVRNRPMMENQPSREMSKRNEEHSTYYQRKKAERGEGSVRKRILLTEEEKKERQRLRYKAWREKNYVRVVAVIPSTTASKEGSTMRMMGQLNIKSEPMDNESEPIAQQIRLDVRRELEMMEEQNSDTGKEQQAPSEQATPFEPSPVQPSIQDATGVSSFPRQLQSPPPATLPIHETHNESAEVEAAPKVWRLVPVEEAEESPSTVQKSSIKCDRLNIAARSYYERKKIEKGLRPVKKKVVLTEDEKRAKRTAACRAWRAYILVPPRGISAYIEA